jgi:hypothetical protein
MRALGAALICIAVFVSCSEASEDPRVGQAMAFDVCTQFVEDRLKAPGTASYPDFWDDDGEVVVSGTPPEYVVTSHVDSENSFGANIRTAFICEVRHVEGDQYRLVDLALL